MPNAVNPDVQKRSFALPLHAGYVERSRSYRLVNGGYEARDQRSFRGSGIHCCCTPHVRQASLDQQSELA